MNFYLLAGLGCVGIISIIAILAMISEIIMAKRHSSIPMSAKVRHSPLAIIIYITDYATVRPSVDSALALTEPTLRVLVVDGRNNPSSTRKLRKTLRDYHDPRVSLYARRTPFNRTDTITAALKHIPRSKQVVIMDSGDLIDDRIWRQLARPMQAHRTLLSLEYSTSAFLFAATHLVRRTAFLFPALTQKLPSGVSLPAPHADSLPRGVYHPVVLSVPGKRPFYRYRLRVLFLLLLISILLLSLSVASLAVSAILHTLQPLLLFGLVLAYIFSLCILEAPFLSRAEKLQLLIAAPVSGLILPVSLTLMSSYELIQRLIRRWPPTSTAVAGSGSSIARALLHPSRPE